MTLPKGINSKHLAAGAPCPPLESGKIRIYNMRFCPFAERTVLMLLAKGIDFEVVNVDLKSKPEWLLIKNPLGKVPVLEKDGKIIYDSTICNEFLEDANVGKKIGPSDSFKKAQLKMILERLGGLVSSLYTVMRNPTDENVVKMNDVLKLCNELLEEDYFSGNDCGPVDYNLWPFLERMGVVESFSGSKVKISKEEHPKLVAYMSRMMERPEIKFYALDTETHKKFITAMVKGEPDYNFLAE